MGKAAPLLIKTTGSVGLIGIISLSTARTTRVIYTNASLYAANPVALNVIMYVPASARLVLMFAVYTPFPRASPVGQNSTPAAGHSQVTVAPVVRFPNTRFV
jgi:hypothetical protein